MLFNSPIYLIPATAKRWLGLLSWTGTWLLLWFCDGVLNLGNLALLLVLGSAMAGIWFSPAASLVACVCSVMMFNWLFVPPRFTFNVDLNQDLLLLVTMLGVSAMVSYSMSRLRLAAQLENEHAADSERMRQLSEQFRDSHHLRRQAELLQDGLQHQVPANVSVLLMPEGHQTESSASSIGLEAFDKQLNEGLRNCIKEFVPLGPGTGRFENQPTLFLPVRGRTKAFGAVDNPSAHIQRQSTAALTLAAIGVVYGDIGTSPLYTVKEVFLPATGVALTPENLIGAVSTIFWALMLIVTLKYVILILRADNRGEGGALALTALAANAVKDKPFLRQSLLMMGLFGATLFYGDSVITPAISVIGAVEGLEMVTPVLTPFVVPISVAVLLLLFFMQRFGTQLVGKFFGPIIVVWFSVLGVTGILEIIQQPAILQALNPLNAAVFLWDRGPFILAAVGAIVLALTGAEALYADMGHFGRKPIQMAWMTLVLPGLALHYMGQGALLMRDPSAIENPFFRMFPQSWLIPAVVLATVAAVIASQAVISGAYSMTKQAILLGFLPRMDIKYTSEKEVGQIYMPAVNWILLVGVVAAVLAFRSSSALAGAYGIAVTLTMVITTTLTFFVVRNAWKLPLLLAVSATLFFLGIDVFCLRVHHQIL